MPTWGELQWRYSGPGSGGGSSLSPLHAGRYYMMEPPGAGHRVIDGASGEVLGGFEAWHTPAFEGDWGYFATIDNLAAVRLDSGSRAWTYAPGVQIRSPPIVAGGSVLVALLSGKVVAVDVVSGRVVWESEAPVAYEGGPTSHGVMPGLAVGHGWLAVPRGQHLSVYRWPLP